MGQKMYKEILVFIKCATDVIKCQQSGPQPQLLFTNQLADEIILAHQI